MAARLGFQWTATDEDILARTLGVALTRVAESRLNRPDLLYRSYSYLGPGGDGPAIRLGFRDRYLSDLIGFSYKFLPQKQAASDFTSRLRMAGQTARQQGIPDPVVFIILDGENAWEYYWGNGREFLSEIYRRIAEDPELETCTMFEATKNTGADPPLRHVYPGSWINSNFRIWIGHPEDNFAWDCLYDARQLLRQKEMELSGSDSIVKAREELLIAEGSDWCWWYGDDHGSANDQEFDALFRQHLSNLYVLLGADPPDYLSQPIKRTMPKMKMVDPSSQITPVIDGRITNYFEWLGAGSVKPLREFSTMHSVRQLLEELLFGFDDRHVYLNLVLYARLPLISEKNLEFKIHLNQLRIRVLLELSLKPSLIVSVTDDQGKTLDLERSLLEIQARDTIEMKVARKLVAVQESGIIHLKVTALYRQMPIDVIPLLGTIEMDPRIPEFQSKLWP
jgi:hypothetical protein